MSKVLVGGKAYYLRILHAFTGTILELPENSSFNEINELKLVIEKLFAIPAKSQVFLQRGGGSIVSVEAFIKAVQDVSKSVEQRKTRIPVEEQFEDGDLDALYLFVVAEGEKEDQVLQKELTRLSKVTGTTKVLQGADLLRTIVAPEIKSMEQLAKIFSDQMETIKNYQERAAKRIELSTQTVFQVRALQEALDVLLSNLNGHLSNVREKLSTGPSPFKTRFAEEIQRFENVHKEFSTNLEKLIHANVHPIIQDAQKSKKTLSNYFDVEKLRNFEQQCKKDTSFFKNKVDITKMEQDLASCEMDRNALQEKFVKQAPYVMLYEKLKKMKENQSLCISDLKTFEEDYHAIVKDSKAGDKLSSCLEQSRLHEETIQRWLKTEKADKELVIQFAKYKLQAINILQMVIGSTTPDLDWRKQFGEKNVTVSQGRIQAVGKQINKFIQILNRHYREYWFLERIQRIPSAYTISLFEVARRHKFRENFFSIIQKMQDKLDQMRADELDKRSIFNKKIGKLVPPEMLPGINEEPPQHNVQILNGTTTTLPVILNVNLQNVKFNDAMQDLKLKSDDKLLEDELKALYLNINDLGAAMEPFSPQHNNEAIHELNAQKQAEIINDIGSKMDSLKQDMAILQSKYDKSQEQLVKLNIIVKEKSDEMDVKDKEILSMKEEISINRTIFSRAAQNQDVEKLKKETEENQKQILELKRKYEEDKRQWESSNQSLSDKLSCHEITLSTTKQELSDIITAKSKLETDIKLLTLKNTQLEELKQRNETMLDNCQNTVVLQETEIFKLNTKLSEKAQECDSIRIEKDRWESDRKSLQAQISEHFEKNKSVQRQLTEMTTAKNLMSKDKEKLAQEHSQFKIQIDQLNQKLLSLGKDLDIEREEAKRQQSQNKNLAGYQQTVEEQINSFRKQVTRLESQLKQSEEALVANAKLFQASELQANQWKKKCDELSEDARKYRLLEPIVQEYKQKNDNLAKHMKDLQASIDKHIKEKNDLCQKNKTISIELTKVRNILQPQQEEFERKNNELLKCKQDYNQALRTIADLQKQCTSYKEEFNQSVNRLKYLEHSEKQAQEKMRELSGERDTLKKVVGDLNHIITIYKRENDTAAQTIGAQDMLLNDIVDAIASIPSTFQNQQLYEQIIQLRESTNDIPRIIQECLLPFLYAHLHKQ